MSEDNLPQEFGPLVLSEKRGTGGMGLNFYYRYYMAMEYVYSWGPVILISILCENVFASLFRYCVMLWVEQKLPFQNAIAFFVCYVILAVVFRIFSWFSVLVFLVNGGRRLHNDMVDSFAAVRVSFFDENPTGRLMRRFSGDYGQLRLEIPNYVNDIFGCLAELIWIFVFVSIQAPLGAIAIVPCAYFYFKIQAIYKPASRELQRISKILESPIWSLYNETMRGALTIKAFGRSEDFVARLKELFLNYGYSVLIQSRMTRWLNLRLKFISETFSLILTFIIVFLCATRKMDVSTAGFLMSLTIGLDTTMQWLTRSVSLMESTMVSFERVLEYKDLPKELESEFSSKYGELEFVRSETKKIESLGKIEFLNFCASYRHDLPLVLNHFSALIFPGSKVGIIGRTGAGKSSLFQSLYRMLYVHSGNIFIDGISLHHFPLNEARKVFSIIPQDPYLFSGTLRFNLDRMGIYSDEKIKDILVQVGLWEFVNSLPGQLNYELQERGQNFSLGQRQLLCVARAALMDRPIVLIDEATASVDMVTDALLQKSMQKLFANRTVLTIAHRLETLAHVDQIIEISEGRVLRQGKPQQILNDLHAALLV